MSTNKSTEIIDLAAEKTETKYAVCYASGSTFKPTGKGATTFIVERGKRRLVNRSLCVVQYYKTRCQVCPFSQGEVKLSTGGSDDA
jgi:hypothetical protein